MINKTGKKNSKQQSNKNIVGGAIEKKIDNAVNNTVTVFTKTTSPHVVVQTETLSNNNKWLFRKKDLVIGLYMIIMSIIIFITFFLSIKTYLLLLK